MIGGMQWNPEWWGMVGVALVVSLLFLALSVRAYRRKHLVDNLPTSKTAGVFMGLVEVEGTAEAEAFLSSYMAGRSCVYYEWRVEEEWKRTTRDSNGNSKTSSGWKTVASGSEWIAFYVRDDTGIVRVVPDKAEIQGDTFFERTCNRADPLYYEKGPLEKISHSTGRRRFVEKGIAAHAPLYLIGNAREREDVVAPEIAYRKDSRMFLITTKTQKSLSRGYGYEYGGCLLLPVLISGVLFYFRYKGTSDMQEAILSSMLGWGIGYFSIFLILALWVGYNHLVELRQRVRAAQSMVDIELKRRSTLIPQLVSVVEEYMRHEAWVLDAVADLRTQAAVTHASEEGDNPHAVLPVLFALREQYPELKSHALFQSLHGELVTTEQRIALARNYCNEMTTNYNTRIEVFPNSLIAVVGGFRHQPLIHAENFVRAPVNVKLAD